MLRAVGACLELRIICLTGCLAWGFSAPVLADITPDGSLGNEASRVTPNVQVKGAQADLIEGGATRGENLFHSFAEFNIGELQRVYFANPSGIETILTRVTGSNLSNILGTLGVDGPANLFLLNPNGIVFGAKARLDVAGSFFASTANSLVFGDGQEFSSTSPQAPPLLTINITPGLQYGKYDPRSTITNVGNLAVGQDLTLAAGNLDLQGQLEAGRDLTLFGEDTVSIRDSVAQPFRAYSGSLLLIQGNQSIDIAAHNHVLSGLWAGSDLQLRTHNPVAGDAHYSAGGNVSIEQLDGLPGNLVSTHDPIILTNGDVSLGNYSGASLHILAGGSVTVGDIEINSTDTADNAISPNNSNPFLASLANVTLSDQARTSVVIDGSSQPTLDIRAGIDWTLLGGLPGNTDTGNLGSNVGTAATSANIKVGEIKINAPNGLVLLTNQYQANPSLVSETLKISSLLTGDGTIANDNGTVDQSNQKFSGNGGEVLIDYRGGIEISDREAEAVGHATGTAKPNRIDASSASGKPGDITLVTNDQLSLDSSFIISNTFGTEKGGDITIETGSLFATNGAQIETSTFGQADAGKVTIVADGTVTFEGKAENGEATGIFNNIEQNAIGDSGGISITTGSLFMNDAFLESRITGQGNSGGVTIIAEDQVIVDQNSNSIVTRVEPDAIGNAGNISIDAESVTISNGARVIADTKGKGDSGDITITAGDTVTIDGVASNEKIASGLRSRVGPEREDPESSKQSQAEGGRGNISIKAKSVFVTNGGQVSTEINDKGNPSNDKETGGNISIIAEDDVIFDGAARNQNNNQFSSIIFTRVRPEAEGNGGNVLIKARSVSFTNGAQINSETRGEGNGGNVEIIARDHVLVDGFSELIEKESGIFSEVQRDGQGSGGNISITVTEGSLAITKGAQLKSSTQGQGNGGDVIIKVRDQVSIDGVGMNGTLSGIFSNVPTERIDSKSDQKGGSIDIEANSISVTDRARLDTSTSGNDRGGKIRLTTNTLTVQDRGEISTATLSEGNGGEIFVNAQESVLLKNDGVISSSVQEAATGNGGKINIITSSLSLINGGRIEARTLGFIPAVLVSELANQSYQELVQQDQPVAYWRLDETTSITAVDSSGNGFNGTYSNGVTQGVRGISGTAGEFDGKGGAVDVGIIAPGSELDISNQSFSVEAWVKPNEIKKDQSYLGIHNPNRETNSNGDSLYFRVTEKGFIVFGNFEKDLETPRNIIEPDTWYHIVASYDQDSNTNTIFVNGREISSNNQGAFTDQNPRVLIGNWAEADQNSKQRFLNQPFNGVIDEVAVYDQALSPERITSHFLLGQRNLGLSPESFPDSGANAGEITVKADEITISGVSSTNNNISSGLLSDSSGDFSGQAGTITIDTDSLKVEDGGKITVTSDNGVAGNLDIKANSLLLNNGTLEAKTADILETGQSGANITLNVSDSIAMFNESLISAEASEQAKGGNIDIDTDVLIAFPPTGPNGSDIIAKAAEGQGGEITIDAEDVRLIEERRAIPGNGTNDIDASSDSGTQGIVTINTGNIDPSRGLNQLPINLSDPSSLIVASCPRSGKISVDELGEFIVTGRGGIPASPFDPIIGQTIIADWVTLDDQTLTEIDHNLDNNQTLAPSTEQNSKRKRIVEAQGWMTGPDGTIILTSFPTDTTSPPKPWYHYLSCRDFN